MSRHFVQNTKKKKNIKNKEKQRTKNFLVILNVSMLAIKISFIR